jgi:triacylglycerol lipase
MPSRQANGSIPPCLDHQPVVDSIANVSLPRREDRAMSFLVELAESAYPPRALDRIKLTEDFVPDNALVMMWMAQLAYETAHEDKVGRILASWRMNKRAFASNDPITGLPPRSACVVVAGGLGATIVAFSGTDPLKIEDWITDFTPQRTPNDLHKGFEEAVDTVWPRVEAAIKARTDSEAKLFFTGHSLGGALATIGAARAATMGVTAVYTFGGPRVGGDDFFKGYALGEHTYRLVHGGDIVATVPPKIGGFRHVGDCIQCPTDGRFAGPQTERKPAAADEPDFIESTLSDGLADFRAVAMFRFLRGIGPRPLDRAAVLLPRMVRDHVPSNYFRAFGITL